jgi:O-antigen/teichoic acid export membrane protein
MIAYFRRVLGGNSFVGAVGLLSAGTIFAQGLAVVSLPLLTRLYSPADFDLLAIYSAAVSFLSVAASFRYNLAIPLPQDDAIGMDLLKLALFVSICSSFLLFVFILVFDDQIVNIFGRSDFLQYLWMIPVGVFLASVYDALQYWVSRRRDFVLVTKTRISRSVGAVGAQVGLGFGSSSALGLLLGQMLYGGIGALAFLRSIYSKERALLKDNNLWRLRQTAAQYSHYPKKSVPEAIFNTAANEIPILLIAAVAIGSEAGFLMLAMRVIGLPMSILGSSVSQVFLVEASDHYRNRCIRAYTYQTMLRLLKIGVIPIVLAGALSPLVFGTVFGSEWSRAGEIVAWLTPCFLLQFIASPVSMVLHVVGKLSLSMWFQFGGLVLRVGLLALSTAYAPEYLTETFAISSAMFYAVYLMIIIKLVRDSSGNDSAFRNSKISEKA